jgi:gamma-glutamyl hercynylcysteine S-oxide synthase
MSLTSVVSNAFGRWTGRESAQLLSRDSNFPDVSEAPLDSRRLIRDRRYCCVLAKQGEVEFDELSRHCAWRGLQYEMAYVPGGVVRLSVDEVVEEDGRCYLSPRGIKQVNVEPYYLDRDCITNADFARFVQAGGYTQPQLWPKDILPFVLQFVDRTGDTGPAFWAHGKPPAGLLEHPVVGVCWYEANAYATWAGKRLPTSGEWQRAGTWPQCRAGGAAEQRYPWGNSFDHTRANIWSPNRCATIPVDALDAGNTPNGVRQLVGNVWEWIDTQFCPASEGAAKVVLPEMMAEVRGGAFDTYFASQATCVFRTGQAILSRPANVGFRCCVHPRDLNVPETTMNTQTEDDHQL